jgi:hypothetical protein
LDLQGELKSEGKTEIPVELQCDELGEGFRFQISVALGTQKSRARRYDAPRPANLPGVYVRQRINCIRPLGVWYLETLS